ncbi:hypothetical protein SAICODRAFT_16579 [Saitoella complicata NRRL Y-17804]|uniref:uncharacterized protein n=1 Tax=Saitoella complicata (strain BCRC 22490 / CBS 7301 / JCM 7358 / NBRC 10748 / NRRL Y-17804) TaxID=698492 RepID=UPI000866B79B|nr:uncharacterized protein SAICODRAFT_16579 [Saitoella complicata NRRL Y-17804]ODQ56580.1 hypothetical protein SAICODRAFT_16579 [Saitoella complicata NRRL Y-17804]
MSTTTANNTMNFGPEWMRRAPLSSARASPPPVQTTQHQRSGSGSYSAVLASPTSLHPSSPSSIPVQLTDPAHPFRYSRTEMLTVFDGLREKLTANPSFPLEMERLEIVTSEEVLEPVSEVSMTDVEKKVYGGQLGVNSEVKRREPATPGGISSPRNERFAALGSPRGEKATFGRRNGAKNTPGAALRQSTRRGDYFSGALGGAEGWATPSANAAQGGGSGTFEGGVFRGPDDAKGLEDSPIEEEQELKGAETPKQESSRLAVGGGAFDILAPVGGRGVSRLAKFGITKSEAQPAAPSADEGSSLLADRDFDDDVLREVMAVAADQSRPDSANGMERLQSRFAAQTLAGGAANSLDFGEGRVDRVDRDPFNAAPRTGLGGIFGSPAEEAQAQTPAQPRGVGDVGGSVGGLFEHPIVPSQPTLPPAPPQTTRVMNMPDKLKWLYRDPTGAIQGPFSGLEMHDWYKAGFFQPNLLVKREEDNEFEPLSVLVRRIGNQREPFLVPLPSRTMLAPIPAKGWGSGNQGASGTTTPGGSMLGAVQAAATPGSGWESTRWEPQQPPFANSFPSFGTTLTADQQNALERRKQEEQYLMARQREILQQQQQQQLYASYLQQHHSSAMLQPSPLDLLRGQQQQRELTLLQQQQQQQAQAQRSAAPSPFLTPAAVASPTLANGILGGLSSWAQGSGLQQAALLAQAAQQQAQAQAQSPWGSTAVLRDARDALQEQVESPIAAAHALAERQGLNTSQTDLLTSVAKEMEEAEMEAAMARADDSFFEDEEEEKAADGYERLPDSPFDEEMEVVAPTEKIAIPKEEFEGFNDETEISVVESPAAEMEKEETPESSVVTVQATPLTLAPVPAATPSIAPWAVAAQPEKKAAQKKPTLREIQELEAKKAEQKRAIEKQQAEAALAAEIAQAQLAAQQAASAQLPSNAKWGSDAGPAPANIATLVNAQPVVSSYPAPAPWAAKPAPAAATSTGKKTLAQIQKEEEDAAKKKQAALLQAQKAAGIPPVVVGKSYANAGANSAAVRGAAPVAAGPGWTTVGASGKVSAPPAAVKAAPVVKPVVQAAPVVRAVAAPTVVKPVVAPVVKAPQVPKPAVGPSAATAGGAQLSEGFMNWAHSALKGLKIDIDDFLQMIIQMPVNDPFTAEIISDSVYASSTTIDGRRFAEEFTRRRKSDHLGANASAAAPVSNGGGWNDVVSKAGSKGAAAQGPEWNAAFKVVAKKGGSKKR